MKKFNLLIVISLLFFHLTETIAQDIVNTQIRENFWETDGAVWDMKQSGNTLYLGGDFNYVGPNTGGLVALNPTTAANLNTFPKVNGFIGAVVPDGTGGYYIGGGFTEIGGFHRENLAHMNSAGAISSWNPAPNEYVGDIVLFNSNVYFTGGFTSVGGVTRNGFASVNATTGIPTEFNPNPNNGINKIVAFNNLIYTCGYFTTIGGQSRHCLAALNPVTGNATSWNPNPNSAVYTLTVNGSLLLVGGYFTTISGQNRASGASYNLSGNLTGWNPNLNSGGRIYSIAAIGSTIYIGGLFTNAGGQPRNNLASYTYNLWSINYSVSAWNPNANKAVWLLSYSNNRLFAGGDFTTINNQDRNRIAEVNTSTGAPTGWNPGTNGQVANIIANTSQVLVAGFFSSIGGVIRKKLAAIDVTTGLPTPWGPSVTGLRVNAFALNGTTLYVGGSFSNVGGLTRNNLAAVDINTGTVSSWDPGTDDWVNTLFFSNNVVYAGGFFTLCRLASRNSIAAISASTGIPTNWNPDADGFINKVMVYNGKVYAGGAFSTIGSQPRTNFAALDINTGLATTLNCQVTGGSVEDFDFNGNLVYAGGYFTNAGGAARAHLAAIDLTTGAATSWNPITTNALVTNLAVSGSTLYIGGSFDFINGVARFRTAAFSLTDGALLPWRTEIDSDTKSLLSSGENVYLGGYFRKTGKQPRYGLAAVSRQSLEISSMPPAPYCAGGLLSLAYQITGPYTAGNTFTAQLSNANGDFGTLTTIGSVTSVVAGTITINLPSTLSAGSNYRIRIVASNPSVISAPTNYFQVVTGFSSGTLASADHSLCGTSGTPNNISFSTPPSGASAYEYKWYKKEGLHTAPSGTTVPGDWQYIQPTTVPSFTPPLALTTTTYAAYIAPVTSGTCGGSKWAAGQRQVRILGNFTPGNIGATTQNACTGSTTDATPLSFTTQPTGGVTYSYSWYKRDGNWSAPTGSSIPSEWGLPVSSSQNYDPATLLSITTTYACFVNPNGTPDCGVGSWAAGQRKVIFAPCVTNTITLLTAPASVCNSGNVIVTFSSTGTFAPGNQFQVQMSNASGVFSASPAVLSSGTSSPLTVSVPAGTSSGTGYKFRVVSTSPFITSNLSSAVNILPPFTRGAVTAADIPVCTSTNNPPPLTMSTFPLGSGGYQYQWRVAENATFACPVSTLTSASSWGTLNGGTMQISFTGTDITYDPMSNGANGRTWAVFITPISNGTVPACGTAGFAAGCVKTIRNTTCRLDADGYEQDVVTEKEEPILSQNIPNPYNETTNISCFIHSESETANISIYGIDGKMLQQLPIYGNGSQQVTFNKGNLAAGVYFYALHVDGQQVAIKKMVIGN